MLTLPEASTEFFSPVRFRPEHYLCGEASRSELSLVMMGVGEPRLESGYQFAKSQMLAVLPEGGAGAGVWLLWRPGG